MSEPEYAELTNEQREILKLLVVEHATSLSKSESERLIEAIESFTADTAESAFYSGWNKGRAQLKADLQSELDTLTGASGEG